MAGCSDLQPDPAASPGSLAGGRKVVVFRSLLCRQSGSSGVWRISLLSPGTSLVWPAVDGASQLELALSTRM